MKRAVSSHSKAGAAGRWVAGLLVLSLLGLACGGGGGRSPTQPPPPTPPPPPGGGTIFGDWHGTMAGTRSDNGARVTCTVDWHVEDAGGEPGIVIGIGDWDADCSDGTTGGGALFVNDIFFFLVVIALDASPPGGPFGDCGWAGHGTFNGDRIEGTWQTPQGDCPVAMSGTFEVRK